MPEFRINEEKAMKITHTTGLIDKDSGDEIFVELVRDTIPDPMGGERVFEETLKFSNPDPRSQVTFDARQVFDFLEGSGMT